MKYVIKGRVISMNEKEKRYNYSEKYNKDERHYGENMYI